MGDTPKTSPFLRVNYACGPPYGEHFLSVSAGSGRGDINPPVAYSRDDVIPAASQTMCVFGCVWVTTYV